MTAEPHLTPTELQVLVLLTEGQSRESVALRMRVTPGTVKAHLQNIYDKLGTGSLVGTYWALGWLRVGPVRVTAERPRRVGPKDTPRDAHGRFAPMRLSL